MGSLDLSFSRNCAREVVGVLELLVYGLLGLRVKSRINIEPLRVDQVVSLIFVEVVLLHEVMLDSLYTILNHNDSPLNILNIDYKPILDHYMDIKNLVKVKQYVGMMLENQHVFKQKNLNYNLVEAIVDLQTGKKLQDLKIAQLRHANQRLWLLICIVISL